MDIALSPEEVQTFALYSGEMKQNEEGYRRYIIARDAMLLKIRDLSGVKNLRGWSIKQQVLHIDDQAVPEPVVPIISEEDHNVANNKRGVSGVVSPG